MLEHLPQVARWVEQKWQKSPILVRIGYVFAGVVLLTAAVALLPFSKQLGGLFTQLPDAAQGIVFFAMVVGLVAFVLYSYNRAVRVDELKTVNERLKLDLAQAQSDVVSHDERLAHLMHVESRVKLWQKDCRIVHKPFVPPGLRRARFVTVLNLKGGVGKTTLVANLGASLALAEKPLRVLLVDVDFQGTLGIVAVDQPFREIQEKNGHFVDRLLASEAIPDQSFATLRIGMMGVPNSHVVLAADSLDLVDFELQARFFLDPLQDPRFRFIAQLHHSAIAADYDLVLFDCPPRVTASVVNALLCSDHILIPTRLDGGSIDAVPRTIDWIQRFGALCHATLLGVVASHVAASKDGKLTKSDQSVYARLREQVKSKCGTDVLFGEVVRTTPAALNPKPGTVASTTAAGRDVFAKFVAEFRRRMPL